MPIASAQISGFIGGQQAMFSNNAAFSQQIGGQYGTGPQMPAQPMSNPFPSYGDPGYGSQIGQVGGVGVGTQAAGGLAASIPALAGGVSMAGGLMGGAAGWLDPFTAAARGFRFGVGAPGGAGITGTLGHVGRTFAQGGLRAGMGALGGGMLAGAAVAAPIMVAGAAIQEGAEQMYRGAQNVGDVGRLAQAWGPAYGVPGSRPGGKLPREQIRDIVGTLEDLADQEVLHSVDSLKRLVGRFNQMGMMTGVVDAQTFKQKFGQMLEQVDTIAKVMGTSLEEAAPIFQGMRKMGMWRSQDIMPTVMQMNMLAPQQRQQMMGAMQTGAQISWQQGGRMRAGATMARQQFMQIQGAMRAGTMSEEQLMEMTGGVGGAEGMRMLAEQNVQMQANLARTPMGRAMMAGLGEVREGRFTGNVNQELMQQFLSGGVSINDLLKRGRRATRTRGGAASFVANQERMGQEVMSGMGPEGYAQMIEQMMGRGGFDSGDESIRKVFMQKTMGMNERQARYFSDLIEDLPRIQEEQSRQARDAIEDYYRRVDERMNRSWTGLKDKLRHEWEGVWRPFRDAGARMATAGEQTADELTDWVLGRTRRIRMSSQQRANILMEVSPQRMQESMNFVRGNAPQQFDLSERGLGGGVLGALGIGRTRRERARFAGQELVFVPQGQAAPEAGMVSMGEATQDGVQGQYYSRMPEIQKAARAAARRARGDYNFKDSDKKNINTVAAVLRKMRNDPKTAVGLRRLKKLFGDDPKLYIKAVGELMLQHGGDEARRAVEALQTSRGATSASDKEEVINDALAAASEEAKMPMDMKLAFKEASKDTEDLVNLSAEQMAEREEEVLQGAADALRGEGGMATSIGAGVVGGLGAVSGFAIGGMKGAITGAWTQLKQGEIGFRTLKETFMGAVKGATTGYGIGRSMVEGESDTELINMVNNDKYGQYILKYVTGTDEERAAAADSISIIAEEDPAAKRAFARVQEIMARGGAGAKNLKDSLETMRKHKEGMAGIQAIGKQAELAKGELARVGEMGAGKLGVSEKTFEEFQNILRLQGMGSQGRQEEAAKRAQRLAERLLSEKGGAAELQRLGGMAGGAFGQQVAAYGVIGGLGEKEWGAKDVKKFQQQLSKAGFGALLGEGAGLGDELKEYMKDSKLDVGEQQALKKLLGEKAGTAGLLSETKGGRKGITEQMTKYTQANTQFVQAVGTALMGLVDEKQKTEIGKVVLGVTDPSRSTGTPPVEGAGQK